MLLLINPAGEKFGGMLSRYVPVGIPVGIAIIGAYMKKWGVSPISILDEEIDQIDESDICDRVPAEGPAVIGIGVLTYHAGRAYELARMCKRLRPNAFVVMGGIHVTALPQEALETGAVDVVVRGEGEEVFRQLYFALMEGREWHSIPGLTYLDQNGEIVHNADGELLENLDDVPPIPYEWFNHPKYDMGFITSARGCPYKCTYCSQRILTGLTYRWHSTERVIQNLKTLIEDYGQTSIVFYDDVFSTNKRRVVELCDQIVSNGLHEKCSFTIQTRADNLYDDLMPHLKRANFTSVSMGMETGVERIAEEAQKDQTVATHLEKIKLCQEYGINICLNMIFGFPSETQADRDETFRVVRDSGVGFVKFNNLTPYPGTHLYEEAQRRGSFTILPGWRNFNSTLSATRSIFSTIPLPYVPDGTTEFELKRDVVRRNLQHYFTWKIIRKVLMREKGAGWVALPPRWYLKPDELGAMAGMTMVLLTNLVFSLLPVQIGETFFKLVRKVQSIAPPDDIKRDQRTFRRGKAPEVPEDVTRRSNEVAPEPATREVSLTQSGARAAYLGRPDL